MKTVMNNVNMVFVTGRSNPCKHTYGARIHANAPLYLMVERTCGIQHLSAGNTPCTGLLVLLTSWLPRVSRLNLLCDEVL